jgi:hypothetical protein
LPTGAPFSHVAAPPPSISTPSPPLVETHNLATFLASKLHSFTLLHFLHARSQLHIATFLARKITALPCRKPGPQASQLQPPLPAQHPQLPHLPYSKTWENLCGNIYLLTTVDPDNNKLVLFHWCFGNIFSLQSGVPSSNLHRLMVHLLFRYHEDGSKKLNVCSLFFLLMVYF